MKLQRDTAWSNPLYYLNAFGLTRGLWMPWLISRGHLCDWRNRPVAVADFGDTESRAIAEQVFPGLRIDDGPVLR